jgi:Ca2+-binding RTX toxin-like protein
MKFFQSFIASIAVFLTAGSAMASTASVSGGQLHYTAANNEINAVLITLSGNTYTIEEVPPSTATIAAPPPGSSCTRVNTKKVTCTATITQLNVSLGNLNDILYNGTSTPIFALGGPGADEIHGGDGVDLIDGEGHTDTIFGRGGVDTLIGGSDTPNDGPWPNHLYGGPDNDWLIGGAGNDILHGGAGNDTLNGGHGADELNGDEDNDAIDGGGVAFGQSLRDLVAYTSAPSAVTIDMNSGTLNTGSAGTDTISNVQGVLGSPWADTLTASNQGSVLRGGEGNDTLYGRPGNDRLLGEGGTDTLFGRAGADYLAGGAGDDTLHGEEGPDYLLGDDDDAATPDGNDWLVDFTGNNVLRAGAGNDVLQAQNNSKDVVECDVGTNIVGTNDTALIDLSGTETAVVGCENISADTTAAAPPTNAYCPVKAIVQPVCVQCHNEPGQTFSARSLLTFSDTQEDSTTPGEKVWQRMKFRVSQPSSGIPVPMPLAGEGLASPLPAPERNVFAAWPGAAPNGGTGDTCP